MFEEHGRLIAEAVPCDSASGLIIVAEHIFTES